MKVMVYYFAEELGTVHGTPLLSTVLDVPPSMTVHDLKLKACLAAGFRTGAVDKMAVMTPRASSEEYRLRYWTDPVLMFKPYRLDESLTVEEIDLNCALSIDPEGCRKCMVCGKENSIGKTHDVDGLDNIPDYKFIYYCSNSECTQYQARKYAYIRIAQFTAEDWTSCAVPIITDASDASECLRGYLFDVFRRHSKEYNH